MPLQLKPSRVQGGIRLPPIQYLLTLKGKTSLMYTHATDPFHVQVYTIEEIKLRWWQHIGLIASYTDMGYAIFDGWLNGQYTTYDFPLYYTLVQKLQEPTGRHLDTLNNINQALDAAHEQFTRRGSSAEEAWRAIAYWSGGIPELRATIDYIWDIRDDYYPDMGEGDWMVWRNRLICIDPYHAKAINPIFRMSRSKPE